MDTLGILGLHGEVADPNETNSGLTKFDEIFKKNERMRDLWVHGIEELLVDEHSYVFIDSLLKTPIIQQKEFVI